MTIKDWLDKNDIGIETFSFGIKCGNERKYDAVVRLHKYGNAFHLDLGDFHAEGAETTTFSREQWLDLADKVARAMELFDLKIK